MSIGTRKKRVVLGPRSAGIRLTAAEFDAIRHWNRKFRYELINGVLVVSPAPLDAEVGPNDKLAFWLTYYQEYHPKGSALDATLPERMVITRKNRRRADRLIWAGLGRQPNTEKDVATIAIEFVSSGKRNWLRDYEEKRDEYMEIGVQQYWIINRFERTMTVYVKKGKSWHELVLGEKDVYRTPLLPGFELSVGKLLGVADQWKQKKRKRER